MERKWKFALPVLAIAALASMGGTASAMGTAEDAEKLKTTLTPMGGERAGNGDGTIPAWSGGLPRLPPGIKDSTQDLFPEEKPLFSITAANVDGYGDKVSEGIKAWLKKWPAYRLDVYPTHRTHATPEYIEEETFRNVTRAKVTDDGASVENAIGGPPFPIPASGVEIMWNHQARWKGEAFETPISDFIVTPSGKRMLSVKRKSIQDFPYSYRGMTSEKLKKEYGNRVGAICNYSLDPPDQVGNIIAGESILDYGKRNPVTYQYLVGQRRARQAPSVEFDARNSSNSGASLVDESWIFNGSPDRYTWKIIGKKEMYIPYNNNGFRGSPIDAKLMAHYFNPDMVRWELHRVWVVDARLKPGKHHTQPHRVFYVDEDSWTIALEDAYDGQEKLMKAMVGLLYCEADLPGVQQGTYASYNIQAGTWAAFMLEDGGHARFTARRPNGFYSPESISSLGVR